MDQILLWISLAAGLLTLAKSLLRSRWPMSSAPAYRRVEIAALLVVAGGAAVTLLQQPPFSPGQTLWPGLLLGAVVTLFGSAVASAGSTTTAESGIGAWGGRFGAATAGLAALLIPYSSRALDVLSGYALGALATAILVAGTLRLILADDEEARTRAAGAEASALLVVTLAAADYLATFHRGPTGIREWQSLPALLAATGGLILSVRAMIAAPAGRGWLYGLTLVVVPVAVVAGIAAARLNGTLPFLWVVLLGLGLFAFIAVLDGAASPEVGEKLEAGSEIGLMARLIAALLVIGGGVIAFRELHGFGLALLVLSGWIAGAAFAAGPITASFGGGLLSSALGLGLMMTLYRVFMERNDYTRGFQADFLYYYAALLVGVLLPALLATLGTSRLPIGARRASDLGHGAPAPWGSALMRMVLIGVLAGLTPLAIWMLIGDRPEAALLVGLAVGAMGVIRPAVPVAGNGLDRLIGPTIALSAVQFTQLVTPLALRTRGQRLEILAAVTLAAVVGLCLTAWWERRGPSQAPVRS